MILLKIFLNEKKIKNRQNILFGYLNESVPSVLVLSRRIKVLQGSA